jgi:hypothetical protein
MRVIAFQGQVQLPELIEHTLRQGVWAYVEGGMGAITRTMSESARAKGVTIAHNATVASILYEQNPAKGNARVKGVKMADGTELYAKTGMTKLAHGGGVALRSFEITHFGLLLRLRRACSSRIASHILFGSNPCIDAFIVCQVPPRMRSAVERHSVPHVPGAAAGAEPRLGQCP